MEAGTTRSIVGELIEREVDDCSRSARELIGEQCTSEVFFRSAIERINGRRLATEGTVSILQQLLIHDAVRLPIRAISREMFVKLHGIQIEVAEQLAEAGLLLPVLTHRHLDNWTEDFPHLHGLIRKSVSSGHRFDAYIDLKSAAQGFDYAEIEANATEHIDRFLTPSRAVTIAPFEQPFTFSVARGSCIKRLAWLLVEHRTEALDLWKQIKNDELSAFTRLRLLYHHRISPMQAAMNGTVVMDTNVKILHGVPEAVEYTWNDTESPIPGVTEACQALLGDTRPSRIFEAPDSGDIGTQRRVADRLIALQETEQSETKRRFRKALDQVATEIANPDTTLSEATVLDALRESDRINKIMDEEAKRIELWTGLASTLAVKLATLGLGNESVLVSPIDVTRVIMDPWVKATLVRLNERFRPAPNHLIRIIRDVRQL